VPRLLQDCGVPPVGGAFGWPDGHGCTYAPIGEVVVVQCTLVDLPTWRTGVAVAHGQRAAHLRGRHGWTKEPTGQEVRPLETAGNRSRGPVRGRASSGRPELAGRDWYSNQHHPAISARAVTAGRDRAQGRRYGRRDTPRRCGGPRSGGGAPCGRQRPEGEARGGGLAAIPARPGSLRRKTRAGPWRRRGPPRWHGRWSALNSNIAGPALAVGAPGGISRHPGYRYGERGRCSGLPAHGRGNDEREARVRCHKGRMSRPPRRSVQPEAGRRGRAPRRRRTSPVGGRWAGTGAHQARI